MAWTTIEVDRQNFIATITLSRPAKANTLTAQLMAELRTAQIELELDPAVRVVVITGAGRHFCGGRDLQDHEHNPPGTGIGFELLSKPVIAAINGAAMGGGCEIALACDFRFASATARIGLPEIRFGELPAGGATARLARIVGLSQAKRLIMTGEPLSAAQAHRIGLVDDVFDVQEFLPSVLAFAATLASRAPYAVAAAKVLLNASIQTDLATALTSEKQVVTTMASPAERAEARAEAARQDPTYARIFDSGTS